MKIFFKYPLLPRFHFSYFEMDRFSLSLGDIIFPQLLFLRLWPETIESSRRNTSRYQRSQSAIRSAMSKLRWCSNFKARCGPEGTIESGSHVNRHLTGTYESNTAFHRRSCHRVTLSFCGWLFDYYYFLVYFSSKLSFSLRDTFIELIIKVSDRWPSCGRHFLDERIQNVDQIS